MQKHGEMLMQQKRAADVENFRCAMKKLFIALAWLWYSESNDVGSGDLYGVSYTRLFFMLLIYNMLTAYKAFSREVDEPVAIYQIEVQFRKAAQQDDVERMKDIMCRMGKVIIGAQNPDTLKNSLHFAVEGISIKAINLLLSVDDDINKSSEQDKPDIINVQDINGNTPIHVALNNLISGHATDCKGVLALIITREKTRLQPSFFDVSKPLFNTNINAGLKNQKGETIFDLASKIPEQKDKQSYNALRALLDDFWKRQGEVVNSQKTPSRGQGK